MQQTDRKSEKVSESAVSLTTLKWQAQQAKYFTESKVRSDSIQGKNSKYR